MKDVLLAQLIYTFGEKEDFMKKEVRAPKATDFVTYGRFISAIEDMKDLIISTAKGTENAIRRDIREIVREEIKYEIDPIKTDVACLKTDVACLKTDVATIKVAVTEHTKQIKALDKKIDDTREDLKCEMHDMEKRLTDKIDENSTRFDEHVKLYHCA